MLSKSFDNQDKRSKRGINKNGHFHVSFWVFVIPCAALFVMFFAVPLVLNIFYSTVKPCNQKSNLLLNSLHFVANMNLPLLTASKHNQKRKTTLKNKNHFIRF